MSYIADIQTVKALLTEAENQAMALGDGTPGAEHLVLAALTLNDPSGRELLGVDAPAFRDAITAVHTAALAAAGIASETALPPVAERTRLYRSEVPLREVLARAHQLAKATRPKEPLQASHIVRAAAERQQGTVREALDLVGFPRETPA